MILAAAPLQLEPDSSDMVATGVLDSALSKALAGTWKYGQLWVQTVTQQATAMDQALKWADNFPGRGLLPKDS